MATYSTPFGAAPFTRAMCREAGVTRHRLQTLLDEGVVRRMVHGVYVDARVPDGIELRARGLGLVVPDGVVVCLRTAAWFWTARVSPMGRSTEVPPVELLGRAGSAASRRRGTIGYTGPLNPDDVVEVGGVRVTALNRTGADVGRLLARPDALELLDVLIGLPGAARDAMLHELDRFAGYRGVVQARELVVLADKRSESPMESRTRLRAHDAGFPPFEPQVRVQDERGRFVARLDLGRREERKAVEYDGDIAHGKQAQQVHDRKRRRAVERCGWGLAVVTGAEVNSRGLAFERGVAELLGMPFWLGPTHPSRGGWDPPRRS